MVGDLDIVRLEKANPKTKQPKGLGWAYSRARGIKPSNNPAKRSGHVVVSAIDLVGILRGSTVGGHSHARPNGFSEDVAGGSPKLQHDPTPY